MIRFPLLILGVFFSHLEAANPSRYLTDFSVPRGFSSVSVVSEPKKKLTTFRITMDPKKFLSFFEAPLDEEKKRVIIRLRTKDPKNLKPSSIHLGHLGVLDEPSKIKFSIPTEELDDYLLILQCRLQHHSYPLIGGEQWRINLVELSKFSSK